MSQVGTYELCCLITCVINERGIIRQVPPWHEGQDFWWDTNPSPFIFKNSTEAKPHLDDSNSSKETTVGPSLDYNKQY